MDPDSASGTSPLPRWAGAVGWALTATAITAWLLVLVFPGAPARSGPNCRATDGSCIGYPYTDAVDYVPGDFVWMVAAFLLGPLVAAVIAALQVRVPRSRTALGTLGLTFAGISAAVLMVDYYVQFTTVQTSLVKGELDGGLSVLSQYNPHGVFVALEDVGYFAMSLAFLLTGFALADTRRSERVLRRILIVVGALGVGALPLLVATLGTEMEYSYEVLALTVCWLGATAAGILVGLASRPYRA